MKHFIAVLLLALFLLPQASQAQVSNKGTSGVLKSLRVNNVGITYGPPNDNITAEVIVKLQNDNKSYGFQLRKDANEISRQGMLDLLRDAYVNDFKVNLTYSIKNGSTKGRIIVVELTK